MSDNLNVLVGETKAGDFVLNNQQLATDDGFSKVSKIWFDQTLTYEQGKEQIHLGKMMTEDLIVPVTEMVPTVDDEGKFALRFKDGRFFRPTPHCMEQMGNWSDCGTWYVREMTQPKLDVKGKLKYNRDRGDAETLAAVIANGFRRLKQDKKFLFRTRNDGTLRAMMSDIYAIVNNEWLINLLNKLVPGGRLSHWRGDSDTLWGNVLIPDTIRQEADSEYGGMLSIGNSEIGERRLITRPSIFRAICMNGCIWDQVKGTAIKQVHRGKIDLGMLEYKIKLNLDKQIPLLPQGIDKLLKTKTMAWDGDSIKPLFAQVAMDYSLSKKVASGVLDAYNVESRETPDYAKSLFAVTNSVTRAGQKLENAAWYDMDEIGGKLINMKDDAWESLTKRAKSLTVEETEKVFDSSMELVGAN